jgi:hypothetical protein
LADPSGIPIRAGQLAGELQLVAVSGIRRDAAALAIARGLPISQVAQETKISQRSLFRWMAEDEPFQMLVEDHRRELRSQAYGRLSDWGVRASDTLGQLLSSEDERMRLQAARSLLAALGDMRPMEKVEEQVAELAQILRQNQA